MPPVKNRHIGSVSSPANAAVLSISLTDISGNSSNVTTFNSPLIATARIVDSKGAPIPNTLLAFSSDLTLVGFQPGSGSLMTDADGSVK
jgi:hypothetical protein